MILKKMFKRCVHAFCGLRTFFVQDESFRVHVVFAFIVFVLGFILNVSKQDWFFLSVFILFVFVTEMINSILEKMIDLSKPQLHHLVKEIKDMMSAVVLLISLISMIFGLWIFVGYL